MSNPFKKREVSNKSSNKFPKEENIFKRHDVNTNVNTNHFQKEKHKDYKDKRNNNRNRDYKNNQFRRQTSTKKEEEFKVKVEEFPELISTNKVNPVTINSYINRVNKETKATPIKETTETPGWTILSLNKKYNTFKTPEEDTEYFNPMGAKLIWENRLKFREDLNDILGERSPYWDMSQYEPDFDLNDYEYDENDDEDEDYEEYVEDW